MWNKVGREIFEHDWRDNQMYRRSCEAAEVESRLTDDMRLASGNGEALLPLADYYVR